MLTDTQMSQFERDGYLVLEDVIDRGTIAAIHAEYAELMDKMYDDWHAMGKVPASSSDMNFFDKIDVAINAGIEWYQPLDISLPHSDISKTTPMHIGPAVFKLTTHTNVLAIAEAILGPELTSNPIQHVRIKPPERKVAKHEDRAHIVSTDWHQDLGVTMESADQTDMVTIWLAITDATLENGCLQVKPGVPSEMLPHCTLNQVGITEKHMSRDGAFPTPVRAGGAVVFHPLTPHASLPNNSDEYRWSFDLRYNVTGQSTGRDQFPSFVARSSANAASVLKDWRVWRSMWAETRNRLSQSDHIPQHRWPSDGPSCA